jgi:hypothetical protein
LTLHRAAIGTDWLTLNTVGNSTAFRITTVTNGANEETTLAFDGNQSSGTAFILQGTQGKMRIIPFKSETRDALYFQTDRIDMVYSALNGVASPGIVKFMYANAQFDGALGVGSVLTPAGQLHVKHVAADKVVTVLQGMAGQTADFLQCLDATTAVKARITAAGAFVGAHSAADGTAGLASGTFTDQTGKTVTVKNGLVVSIV